MSRYSIDGLFLTQRITGTQRYAYEIVRGLDSIISPGELEIVIPCGANNIPQYNNISVVKYGKHKGILWQQIDLALYLKKEKRLGLFLNNVLPLTYRKGCITIHDVCYKANPQFYSSLRDKLSMLWHRLNYWTAVHSDIEILTVSEFSKSELIKYYHIPSARIKVVYTGWQHMERIKASETTFERFPMLEKGTYFFSMSTLEANKNFKWILYAAKNNPNEVFAIAGGGKLKGAAEALGFADLPNIHFLGYVSDEDAKSLMANCKAFIFPTLYEGFGLTPLEAIACGCKKVMVSDTPCMHEIYGDSAEYLDPYVYGESNLTCKITDSAKLLDKYSWERSAKILAGCYLL